MRTRVQPVTVQDKQIGPGAPCYIIAEAGVNHNGDLHMAHKLVDAAADCGADAVKFQTFSAEKLVTSFAPKAAYQEAGTKAGESQLDMLRRLELSREAHVELMNHCVERKVTFLSTPFDEASVDFLYDIGVVAYKVGSGDLNNLPLLRHVASKRKPIILSTGMATLDEVSTSISAIKQTCETPLVALHCVSCYPAKPEEINLRAMATLRTEFQIPIGYSDHSIGLSIPLAAVALGAEVIEKHITLDRSQLGPDHAASSELSEFRDLIKQIHNIEKSLGDGCKVPCEREMETAAVARKSLFAARDLKKGSILKVEDLQILRPGIGLAPKMLEIVIGKTLTRSILAEEILTLDHLE